MIGIVKACGHKSRMVTSPIRTDGKLMRPEVYGSISLSVLGASKVNMMQIFPSGRDSARI